MGPYRTAPVERPSWWTLMRARWSVFAHWWVGPTIPHWAPDIRRYEREMRRRKAHLAATRERRLG